MKSTIPGYDLVDKLYESDSSLICRASHQTDQTPVILKILRPDAPPPEALRHFRREYDLTSTVRAEGIITACALHEHRNTLFMVLQDIDGASLDRWLVRRRPSLAECLSVALRVADALANLYTANIIHNSLNPTNIIWNPDTGQVELADFGAATLKVTLANRRQNARPPRGILAYASPEQTGRIDSAVDHRSDLYSLGVTLYEMLAGRLPFRSNDAMALVHGHIAQQPTPVCKHNAEVPPVVSDIVMKLLEKDAADRYQSAYGLTVDLQACLDGLSRHGDLHGLGLKLARHDLSPQLQIPKKLYGREPQAAALRRAFDRVCSGNAEFVMIAGWSGVGKTALVQYFHQSIASTLVRPMSGKLDQFKRGAPYHAITQTFNELCRDLLTQEPHVLSRWKERLCTTVGDNGQVLIDIIPDLERIIGKQPVAQPVGSAETKHRFNLVFLRFIHALCERDHPLVLFLDDLQWADRSTLDLIELMATDPDARFLLLVGAYRDNEVSDGHPLLGVLDRIKNSARLSTISLPPLSRSEVTALLNDTMPRRTGPLSDLARLVHGKTSGNPFFLGQFLEVLHERNLLRYDGELSRWSWDMDGIFAQDITDNVVELMIHRLQLLPQRLQQITRIAACIGERFDLQTLSNVLERPPDELLGDLLQVTAAGFLVLLDETAGEVSSHDAAETVNPRFRFMHDRVRQAAYALMAEEERKAVHATIGRLLLQSYLPHELEYRVFSVVKHLNVAHDLLTADERLRLAGMNLVAGTKARESTAYEPALHYLNLGLALLPADSWQSNYDLCLALYQEAAEAAYISGSFAKAFALAEVVDRHGKTIYDRVRTYTLKMEMEAAQLHTPRVIELTVETLRMLGIALEEEAPEALDMDGLLDMPRMSDRAARAAMPVLSNCVPAAYQSDLKLLHQVVYTMVKLSVRHGNNPHSAFGYVMYGLLLSSTPETIGQGYRFGKMALKILKKFRAKAIACRVEHIFHSHIRFTTDPLRDAIGPMQDAIYAGLAAGDLEFVSYISNIRCLNILFSDPDLVNVREAYDKQLRLMKRLRIEHGVTFTRVFRQLVLNLTGQSQHAKMLIGPDFNEASVAPHLKEVRQFNLLAYLYTAKVILSYLLGDRRAAFVHARTLLAEKYDHAMSAMYVQHVFQFYCCLVYLDQYETLEGEDREACLRQVELYHRHLRTLSEHCPENYKTLHTLVAAEKERAAGSFWRASELYDQAVLAAQAYRLVQLEALGNELAGRLWTGKGKDDIAALYLRKAHYCYGKWGARRKVEDLEARYPRLFADVPPVSTGASSAPALDISTFIKASHAIAGEFDVETLLSKVMAIILENAGAQKAVLVLARDDDFVVEAVASEAGDVELDRDHVIEQSSAVPASILRLVLRTAEPVLLGEASADSRFSHDSYLIENQVRSVLCIPILHRETIIGAIYLENNLISGAFSPEREQLLRLLANQAGISLENARLLAEKQRYAEELVQEIAVRKQVEEKLRERERDLFVTLHSIGDAVIATDKNLEITRMNAVAERLTGWRAEEAEGMPLDDVFRVVSNGSDERPPRPAQIGHGVEGTAGRPQDAVLVARDGKEIRISDSRAPIRDQSGETIGLVLVFRDVTERHMVERRLRHSQRMEAIGQLAGGIAHDFNNLLMGIQGRASLLQVDMPSSDPHFEHIAAIEKYTMSASDLTKQLLGIARGGKYEIKPVNISELLLASASMFGRTHKEIQIMTDIDAEPIVVEVDKRQIEQVFLNIFVNALQAMPEGGELYLETSSVSLDAAYCEPYQLNPGRFAKVSFTDTGIGMDKAILQRIFDPFFTTKDQVRGTGLGLASSYGIIKNHAGMITVYSEVGRGSTFNIYLPISAKEIQPDALPNTKLMAGSETILLVDDEKIILDVGKAMLTKLGYAVLVTQGGDRAIDIISKTDKKIDLVILDMVMPGMDGGKAFDKIRQIQPALPVILCSGYSINGKAADILRRGCNGFIQKPFNMSELSQIVRKVINET
jgi:PAS domain S-box-containing protein